MISLLLLIIFGLVLSYASFYLFLEPIYGTQTPILNSEQYS